MGESGSAPVVVLDGVGSALKAIQELQVNKSIYTIAAKISEFFLLSASLRVARTTLTLCKAV